MKRVVLTILLSISFFTSLANGLTIYVDDDGPADFNNIQAAIDDANNGDTVLVADGIYTGDGNLNIDFKGKPITVCSQNGPQSCVIDCNGQNCGFYFHSKEYKNSVLDGFTITNASQPSYLSYGGGIHCYLSSPTIKNCIIRNNNTANYGGGICCIGKTSYISNPIISNCTISNNTSKYGGGIHCAYSNPTISNCIISNNTNRYDGGGGGGIYCNNSNLKIGNCVVTNNKARQYGGGIYSASGTLEVTNCTFASNVSVLGYGNAVAGDGSIIVKNCILWDNGKEIYGISAIVTYSDVCGGRVSEDNINADPMFTRNPNDGGDGWGDNPTTPDIDEGANDDFGDLHLQPGSPCINAGDPNLFAKGLIDIDGQPRIMGHRVDMGADEFFLKTIGVSKPEGGEIWISGSTHGIEWYSHLYEGTIDIWFSEDGGGNWRLIENNLADTGSYLWHLPDVVDSNQCLIKVVPTIPDANVVCVESGLFTIHPDSPGPTVTSKWVSLGGDFRRTGLSQNYGPEHGCVKWRFEMEGAVPTSVTVGFDERVHIACEDGKLYTLDIDGEMFWSYDTNSPLTCSPTIGPDGTIYVGSQSGKLYAIDINGRLRWTHNTGNPIHSSPAVSEDGKIFLGSEDGALYALASDGSELWTFQTKGCSIVPTGSIFASPAIGADGTVYIAGLYEPNLYALDPNDGAVKWVCDSKTRKGWSFASPVIAENGTIYQTMLFDPNLYAINPNTGTIIWSKNLTDPCRCTNGWSEPVLGPDGTIYVSFDDPYLHAVDPNGSIKWIIPLGKLGGFTLTVGNDGLIYAAGDDGYLYVVDQNGWLVSQFKAGSWLNYPVIARDNEIILTDANDNSLLITHTNNTLWAIGRKNCRDLNFDGTIDFSDVALLTEHWLECTDVNYHGEQSYLTADVDGDNYVRFSDLALIANLWHGSEKLLKPSPHDYHASNPYPPNGSTYINVWPTYLSWTSGFSAVSHNVYFGTTNPPPFVGSQIAAIFELEPLVYATTYYWRIDEVNQVGTTTGELWSFTTRHYWIFATYP